MGAPVSDSVLVSDQMPGGFGSSMANTEREGDIEYSVRSNGVMSKVYGGINLFFVCILFTVLGV